MRFLSFGDFLKKNAKDNLKGLLRGGGSPSETFRQTSAARRERQAKEELLRRLGQRARVEYQKSFEQKGRDVQYADAEVSVKVKNGYDSSRNAYTTDIVVYPRGNNPKGSHWHSVFDEHGNALIDEWREK